MKTILKSIVLFILTFDFVNAQQESSFSQKGSLWLGGGVNYSSMDFDGAWLNIVQITPVLRFFPADHFMLGPNISWTGLFADGLSMNQLGIGLEVGGVFNNGGKAFPYIRSGGSFALLGSTNMPASTGFSLPVAGGVIIPLGKIFALQIEPTFTMTWTDEKSRFSLGMNFGICGIGEKSAVSVMQGLSGLVVIF